MFLNFTSSSIFSIRIQKDLLILKYLELLTIILFLRENVRVKLKYSKLMVLSDYSRDYGRSSYS